MKPKKLQKILLAGGTGFIGSELLKSLILAGYDVIGVSRKEIQLIYA